MEKLLLGFESTEERNDFLAHTFMFLLLSLLILYFFPRQKELLVSSNQKTRLMEQDDKNNTNEGKNSTGIIYVEKEQAPTQIDSDNDGVVDAYDECPNRKGVLKNNGCPAIEIERGEQEILANAVQAVEFKKGSALLKDDSKIILESIKIILNKYPNYNLYIIGHTDNVSSEAFNLSLSQKRAIACYQYLVRRGINTERLITEGKGEREPLVTNGTSEGRAKNRRVEFILY